MEEATKILRGLGADLVGWKSAELADLTRDLFDVRGLITFAAEGNWRQEWRIGLDEHAVERDL